MEKNINKEKLIDNKNITKKEKFDNYFDEDDNNDYEDIHDYKQTISSFYKRTEKGEWFYPDDDEEDEWYSQESDDENE